MTQSTELIDCAELAHSALRELTAYFIAVAGQFGTECARRSAEDWLLKFQDQPVDRKTINQVCRKVTVAAAVQLADRAVLAEALTNGN